MGDLFNEAVYRRFAMNITSLIPPQNAVRDGILPLPEALTDPICAANTPMDKWSMRASKEVRQGNPPENPEPGGLCATRWRIYSSEGGLGG